MKVPGCWEGRLTGKEHGWDLRGHWGGGGRGGRGAGGLLVNPMNHRARGIYLGGKKGEMFFFTKSPLRTPWSHG